MHVYVHAKGIEGIILHRISKSLWPYSAAVYRLQVTSFLFELLGPLGSAS